MTVLEQLLYVSEPRPGLDDIDLTRILVSARRRNGPAGLSGFLAFNGSAFLQVLEGPTPAIDACLQALCGDARHQRMRVLARGPLARRRFADWSMGYAPVATRHHALLPGAGQDPARALREISADAALQLLQVLAAEAAVPAATPAAAQRAPGWFSASSTPPPAA